MKEASESLPRKELAASKSSAPAPTGAPKSGQHYAWTIPIRTVSLTNQREHWTKRKARANIHRNGVRVILGRHLDWLDVPCDVHLTRIAPRALDDDNLRSALKSVRDGVADALGCDDRDPRIAWHYAQARGKPREYAVRIEVRPR